MVITFLESYPMKIPHTKHNLSTTPTYCLNGLLDALWLIVLIIPTAFAEKCTIRLDKISASRGRSFRLQLDRNIHTLSERY
jgi:hypothetical protein